MYDDIQIIFLYLSKIIIVNETFCINLDYFLSWFST